MLTPPLCEELLDIDIEDDEERDGAAVAADDWRVLLLRCWKV